MKKQQYDISDLLEIMKKLRDPNGGCPWDLEQNFETIAPYTIEEAYEVDEAIRAGNMDELRDELGDLLFQAVFHSQMATEEGHFTFKDVVNSVSEKMIRRHPHVFGDTEIASAEAQISAWEEQKAKERAAKQSKSVLDGVSISLPSLLRAIKLQNRAARVGFDWPQTDQVLDKLLEESKELLDEVQQGASKDAIKEEMGDLLFVMANFARHLDVDPEEALRAANAKFERRFHGIEQKLQAQGKTPIDSSLEEMDALWNEVKKEEKANT
ncbi:nucleoside triphosphate pyrophosphohydrolase [Kordiimonas sediminis]|uniref:Nucleoside triphosphate pyrophosphohydrolase n=1 Tax=Kordiimonas sediminis TaxID=1735581 RepID=A0A919E8B4_9PROT|nr:nucleoside triphosphate pyrophosphohydrolase [Kordiimonas sediminis]GHF28179.1 nucleoside triphosphate pyrophosphohydrolase [Kordiimonas sediminis]